MKTTTLLSLAAATSLGAFVSSLVYTQDLIAGSAVLATTMAVLTFAHEYAPCNHFVVTPSARQKAARVPSQPSPTARRNWVRPLMPRGGAVSRRSAVEAAVN